MVNNADVTTYGPYTIDGYNDTFSFNTSTDAFDNYFTTTITTLTSFLARRARTHRAPINGPGVFQVGVDDVGGTYSYIDNFPGTDFIPTDPGLADLGGSLTEHTHVDCRATGHGGIGLVSAAFKLARASSSSCTAVCPSSGRGGTLNSMLYAPNSV